MATNISDKALAIINTLSAEQIQNLYDNMALAMLSCPSHSKLSDLKMTNFYNWGTRYGLCEFMNGVWCYGRLGAYIKVLPIDINDPVGFVRYFSVTPELLMEAYNYIAESENGNQQF